MIADRLRVKGFTLLLLLCPALLATLTRAAGIHEFVIPADAAGPAIPARLWTPCSLPSAPILVKRGTVQFAIRAVSDCAPSADKLPLVVISHGMLEDFYSHHDTAEFLADAGFAVVTFNHTLDSESATKEQVDDMASLLVRPLDVKRVITAVLRASPAFAAIDSHRIGFFGFSRGGYTGLVVAGAVPNFRTPPFPCPDEFLMCRQMRDGKLPKQRSAADPRIRAFIVADPISLFPDKASLREVTAPLQLWSSEQGGMGVRPEDVSAVDRNLPRAHQFIRPEGTIHFSFQFPCSPEEAKAMSFQCSDAPGFDRARFHQAFNERMLEFFRRNL